MPPPARGDVGLMDFNPVVGHEQQGIRPALIISANALNQSKADRLIVMPITNNNKGIPSHVPVQAPEGGLRQDSFVIPEGIRSISALRLREYWGCVAPATLSQVELQLRRLLVL